MSKYGNENAAAGGRNKDTASRDRDRGSSGGQNSRGGSDSKSVGPQGRANPNQSTRNTARTDSRHGPQGKANPGQSAGTGTSKSGMGSGGQNSRGGNNRPSGPFQSPSYSKLTPNGQLPSTGVTQGITDLVDGVINGDVYGKYGEPDLAPKDITPRDVTGDGSGIGNTGGKDWLENVLGGKPRPGHTNELPVKGVDDAPPTLDDYLNQFTTNFIDPNERYYLEQRGLINPNDPAGIPDEWKGVFDREFGRIKNTLQPDLVGPNDKDADVYTKLKGAFTDTFGKNALDAEENRRRNEFSTALQGKGFNNQIDQNFGETSDDDLINSIINPQYDAAQSILTNQQKRGTLTDTGYNYALNSLNQQKGSANTRLQGIGAAERTKASGGINDYLSQIMGKAGGYTLGQQFDPNSFDTEFSDRLNTAKGGLEGNIRGAAPTNLFDTGTVLSNAGSAQGQTSRGGLLDTLAARRNRPAQNRGVGTTGEF